MAAFCVLKKPSGKLSGGFGVFLQREQGIDVLQNVQDLPLLRRGKPVHGLGKPRGGIRGFAHEHIIRGGFQNPAQADDGRQGRTGHTPLQVGYVLCGHIQMVRELFLGQTAGRASLFDPGADFHIDGFLLSGFFHTWLPFYSKSGTCSV